MDISIDQVLEQAGTPVSLPEVYLEINELVDNPRSTAAEIAHTVERDVGLTARILKIVNSPYYGFPSTVDTISRAITIIGTRDLRDLALATTTIDLFAGKKNQQENIRDFWRHSIYVGVIAKMLAENRHDRHTERYFVAGLLHDIGRLILYQALPEVANLSIRQAREQGEVLYQTERVLMGYTHTDIGKRLAELWNLPAYLVESIAYHHEPDQAVHYALDVSIVHIANFLANSIDFSSNLSGSMTPLDPRCWQTTGLSLQVIEKSLPDLAEKFTHAYGLLIPQANAA